MKINVSAQVTLLFEDVGSAWTGGHTLEQITREGRTVAMNRLRLLLADKSAPVAIKLVGEPAVTVIVEDKP